MHAQWVKRLEEDHPWQSKSDASNWSLRDWVSRFGSLAFRRPLHEDELDAYVSLLERASDLAPDSDSPEQARSRLLIEVMLQSPAFLYRSELMAGDQEETMALDAFSLAARLSFFILDAPPDAELYAAAHDNSLLEDATLREQTLRLLDSEAAKATVQRFHEQLLDADRVRAAHPSPDLFPQLPTEIGERALEEQRRYLEHMIFEEQAGWGEILVTPGSVVDADLARNYGVEWNSGEDWKWIDFPSNQRAGLLGQTAFLVGHATSSDPDPIHRGAFVARRLACIHVAAPPGDIPPLPKIEGKTNREAVEAHTEAPGSTCAGCHAAIINPLGFPFEHFGADARYREQDHGFDVDSRSTIYLDGEELEVSGSIEFAHALAQSKQVHACYAQHWLEYAKSGLQDEVDDATIDDLVELSLGDAASVKELMTALVLSPSFRARHISSRRRAPVNAHASHSKGALR